MTQAWSHTITRGNIEQLLDNGLIEVHVGNGRWWKARRNGKTQRWKRSLQMRIPIKAGLRNYGEIMFSSMGQLWMHEDIRLKTWAR